MRFLISLLWIAASAEAAAPFYTIASGEAGAWPDVLSSIGLQRRPADVAHIFVAGTGTAMSGEWGKRLEQGAVLILEGESPLAEHFGFVAGKRVVRVTSVTDSHRPELPIVWEKSVDLPVFELPAGAVVFAKERWGGTPLVAGIRAGGGSILWLAVGPGDRGYERFPYLLNALVDSGVEPPFRSSRLWAFFDSAYRSRVDVDYFVQRWRKAGISALQVAAWHFFEPDAERDVYLAKLIEACHREGILVYGWLELPHVSEKFWTDHPEWREKTALLQDAHLDWRKLMNLTNRDCFRAVSAGVERLVGRFDWDGINLGELYFESLQGIANPSRFTPMNDDVRAQFRKSRGFDPTEVFGARQDEASRQLFLQFRSELAGRMQEEWILQLEYLRRQKPHLDLVLTHVDDRFDTGMRDAIGADAARVLPLAEKHGVTFLIEDPATVWHLGPQRYHAIAERYRGITSQHDKLAIDLNIVDRYQDVYPTKQQTGIELLQLVHNAAANFQRVALYFEFSLQANDLRLLPSAAAGAVTIDIAGSQTLVNSAVGVGLPWKGPVVVDGSPWPASDDQTVWLPAGAHRVESGKSALGLHLVRLNGELKKARVASASSIEFTYESVSRAIAILDRPVGSILVDGVRQPEPQKGATTVFLPRGRHEVVVSAEEVH